MQKRGVNAGKGRRGGEKGEERGKTGVQKRGVNAGKGRRGGEKGEEIRKTGVQNNCVKTKTYKHPSRESFFIYPDCFCYQKVQGGHSSLWYRSRGRLRRIVQSNLSVLG